MSKTVEKLDEVGVKTIASVEEYGAKLVSFLEKEVPSLIEEVVLFSRIYNTFWFVFCFVGAIVSIIQAVKIYKLLCNNTEKNNIYFLGDGRLNSKGDMYAMTGIIIGCIGVGFTIATCNLSYWVALVWFAPRVYLLDYFSNMVK